MTLSVGLDLGTTTVTALALDLATGRVAGRVTRPNACEVAPGRPGRSEWDADAVVAVGAACLRELAGTAGRDVAGLCVTGQQHGVVLIDDAGRPLSPLVNWQDRRADEPMPGTSRTWADEARALAGDGAARAGCRLAAGYLAVTLFWLSRNGGLPARARACFLMDHATAALTGAEPTTDPTCAASSGALDVARRDWDDGILGALGLSRGMLPRVVPSGTRAGGLAAGFGLPAGVPVFVGVGDNQASFFGSVADRESSVLVNVGTGGQVAAWTPDVCQDRQTEARPFFDGYLAVSAGLAGGAAYAALERFFREVGRGVLGVEPAGDVYEAMNRLAAEVPAGADGLSCEPFFAGTRHEPWLRASWSGLTLTNFTPGHLSRALLEGMARAFGASVGRVSALVGRVPCELVGAGNGVRTNALLAGALASAVGLPMRVPAHREEAAYGAALLAGVGAGVVPMAEAGRLVTYRDF